jgi:hypothetical protein
VSSRKNHETRLQFVLVDYLRTVLPLDAVLWHCPNGGKMSSAWRKMLGGLGVLAGASDLMMVYGGRFYAIELKTEADPVRGIKKTYQKPNQKDFEAQIVRAGGYYAVCRSTDDARELLAHWGIPTREIGWP